MPLRHWRGKTTCRKIEKAYGRWLTFIDRIEGLDPNDSPADRVTLERLKAWVAELTDQVSSVTLTGLVRDLGEAIRVMEPGADLSLLSRVAANLKILAVPTRDKRRKYVHPRKLLELGVQLYQKAETEPCARMVWRAGRVRDAMLILTLTFTSLRRRNLTEIEIGNHLQRSGEGYRLSFGADEMKGRRLLEESLSTYLTPFLDRYIGTYRPILLAGRQSSRLWISNLGTDMAQDSIYARVCAITFRELGIAVNPHAFRCGPFTAMAIEDPEHAGAAATILHHASSSMITESYDLAGKVQAVRSLQANLSTMRGEIRKNPSKRRRTIEVR